MAQVKKFQKGGGLYLDGKQLTDEQINAAMDTLSAEDKYTWSKSIERARAGERVDLNELSNSVAGGDFSHVLNERQQRKNESGNLNRRQRNRHATWGTNIDSTNRGIANGIAALKSQLNVPVKEEVPETQTLGRGSGWFSFGEDGIYNEGPQNLTNEKLIKDAFAWLGGDENYRKGWTVSGYDNNDTLNGLSNWYKGQNADELIGRIKNNTLSEDDYEVLAALGFQKDGNTSVSPDSKKSHADWKGNADAASRAGVYFTKDKDGNWFLNNTGDSSDYLGQVWYNGGLDFLSGTEFADGMIGADGRLYTRADILGGKYQDSRVNAFLSAQNQNGWRNWYDAANASGVRFTGDRTSTGGASDNYGVFNTQFNPSTHYNEYWSDYFSKLGNKPYDIADLSNNFGNLNGRQVIAYVDPSGTKDAMGIRGVKYVVRNADGTYSSAYDNEAALMQGTGLTAPTQWWTPAPGEFNQNLWETIGNKQYSLAHELNTQGDQQNVIMRGKDGNWYLARKSGDVHVKPKLIKNIELLNQILANPQNYKTSDIENLTEGSGVNVSLSRAFARRQDGGTIPKIKELPKFQYGGAVAKSNTKSEVKSTEGLRTDITSTHKRNGSDGGLTKAEKLQITAAFGDLAGIGLSFAPGVGNVAGAAVGLGSTATRLVADIKKDGFQAKDAWNAAGGALLDLATIIPGLGTGAKTAKAVKAIKAAATPIMKVLSLAGAAQGVAAMGKVIRGEELTSEDLTAIISGLGSTAIAGKQLKDSIGNAKLAKELEAKSLAGQTTISKPTAEIGGKKMEIEVKALEGKTMNQVEEMLKKKVQAELGDKFKEGEHDVDLLTKFGIDKSTSRNFSVKNLFKKGEKALTTSETPSFSPTEAQTPHSTLYYMLNPYARLKQTGFDWGYVQRNGNLGNVDKKELNAAFNAVIDGKASLDQIALVKQAGLNPNAFKFQLDGYSSNLNGGWGWPIYGRNRTFDTAVGDELIDPESLRLTNPKTSQQYLRPIGENPDVENPDVIRRRNLIKLRKQLHQAQPLALPAPSAHAMKVARIVPRGNSVVTPDVIVPGPWSTTIDPNGMLARQLDLELGYLPRPYSRKGVQMYDLPIGYGKGKYDEAIQYLAFQKGGKIQKAQPGSTIKLPQYIETIEDDIIEPSLESEINKHFTGNAKTTALGHLNDAIYNASIGTPELEASIVTAERSKKTPAQTTGNPVGTRSQFGKNVLPALPAVTSIVGKATSGIRATNQQLQLAKDTYNSTLRNLEQNVPEHYQQYTEAGIDSDLSNVANKITSQANKAMYNDPTLNEAVRMQGAEKVSHLYAQGFDQKRKMFQNWLDKDNELRRNYALQRTAVENANRQRIAQADAYLNQQKGAAIAQKQGIYQGAMQDMGSLLAIPRQSVLSQEQMDATRDFNKWKAEKQGLYQSGINSGSIASGTSFDSWLSGNQGYLDELYAHQDKIAGIASKLKYLNFLKSGGKVSRHRPEAEQIRINQQKIVADAIKQLSKQSFEFLKMALS